MQIISKIHISIPYMYHIYQWNLADEIFTLWCLCLSCLSSFSFAIVLLPKIISEIQILWDQLLKMRIGWSRYYVDVSVAHHWTKWTYNYSCPIKFIFKYKNVDWRGGTCTGLTVCVGEHFFYVGEHIFCLYAIGSQGHQLWLVW